LSNGIPVTFLFDFLGSVALDVVRLLKFENISMYTVRKSAYFTLLGTISGIFASALSFKCTRFQLVLINYITSTLMAILMNSIKCFSRKRFSN